MKLPPTFLLLACSLIAATSPAETVKDREGAVRNDKAVMEKDARWIYNDVARGFAEAKRTGKPLLVVLRCVPCLACAGIDAQVLLHETELTPLLDQFVCVRVINANALDLALFQFDYDLSFTTIFFHADGTVLGRYGSWTHQKDAQEKSTASFRHALKGVLAQHREYPANKASLAGKQGGPMPFKVPVEMPALASKYTLDLNWDGKVVQSCVHCHQIGDAIRLSYRDQRQPIPSEWIYPFPATETIGLTMAADSPARVEAVAENSIAAQSGLRPGATITSLDGQKLVSTADFSWLLHRAPDSARLEGTMLQDGRGSRFVLNLPAGWRSKTDIARRVGNWPMRGMAFGGMKLDDLADDARASHGLDAKELALFVNHVGQYGKHAAAKNAGFQKGDIIVAIDGLKTRHSEGELLGHLLQKHQPGVKVQATVLRGTQRVQLALPMQ